MRTRKAINTARNIVRENLLMINFTIAIRFRIAVIAAVLSLSTLAAEACSCASAGPGGCQVPVADIIVRATVVSKEGDQPRPPFAGPASSGAGQRMTGRPAGAIPQPEPWGRVKVTLSVSETFRGAGGNILVVRTEVGTEACGYPFEVGHEYLVFANRNQEKVTVTTCSATQLSKMAVCTDRAITRSSRRKRSAGPVWVRRH